MRRQWLFTFLAIPTLLSLNGTTGIFNEMSASSFPNLDTTPTVTEVFIESIMFSLGLRGVICIPPTYSLNSLYLIVIFVVISGSLFSRDATHPDSVSAFPTAISNSVSIAALPPGVNSFILFEPLNNEAIFVLSVLYFNWLASLVIIPGFISITSPTLRDHFFNVPPKTAPCRLFGFVPGLFISKLLATRNRGVSFGFLSGTLTSQSAS